MNVYLKPWSNFNTAFYSYEYSFSLFFSFFFSIPYPLLLEHGFYKITWASPSHHFIHTHPTWHILVYFFVVSFSHFARGWKLTVLCTFNILQWKWKCTNIPWYTQLFVIALPCAFYRHLHTGLYTVFDTIRMV